MAAPFGGADTHIAGFSAGIVVHTWQDHEILPTRLYYFIIHLPLLVPLTSSTHTSLEGKWVEHRQCPLAGWMVAPLFMQCREENPPRLTWMVLPARVGKVQDSVIEDYSVGT